MAFERWPVPFVWYRYTKKMQAKIDRPRCAGAFDERESSERAVRLIEAAEGSLESGNRIAFYWLVDPEDGTVIDVKFQMFGQSALIAAAEAAAELTIGKNYDQAGRLTADLIDKHLRDRGDTPAFPNEAFPLLNLVVDALEAAADQCQGIPLPTAYAAPPVPIGEVADGAPYPGWATLAVKEQLAVIEAVLDADVRPYIALDAGGVEVLNLVGGREVVIAYQGTCTSCYSAVGSTLSYIQQTLRAKVHPDLVVTPDIEFDQPYPY